MEAYSQQLGGSLEGLLPPDCGLRYMLSGLSQVKAFCSPFPCLNKWLHLQKKAPDSGPHDPLHKHLYVRFRQRFEVFRLIKDSNL